MGERLRILHVEDDANDAELVRAALEADGFPCEVTRVWSEAGVDAALDRGPYDLVFSDFTIPGFDGFRALDLARRRIPEVPFIIVSGTIGEERAIESLKRGATDYVLKARLARLGPAVRRALHEVREREEREAIEAQLRHSQRTEALGQLSGGIAHDFNNLLTVILANAELIADALPPDREDVRTQFGDIVVAARSGADLVRRLLAYGRRQLLQPRPLDLPRVLFEMSKTLRRVLPSNIEVRAEVEADVPFALADPGAVEQIVLNLATNARDAMPQGGVLTVSIGRVVVPTDAIVHGERARSAGEYVCLGVTDTGAGMDDMVVQRVFEPFFTTKPPGKGTGLGMPMVYGLARQHGGFVTIESEIGRGTTVSVRFPAAARTEAAAPSAVVREAEEVRGGTETVLVVDDDDALRRVAERALRRLGYTVLAAADGGKALEMLRSHEGRVDLIVSDMIMPGMTGLDLLRALGWEEWSGRFVITSGYDERELGLAAELGAGVKLLPKPWAIEDLAGAVRGVLDARRP